MKTNCFLSVALRFGTVRLVGAVGIVGIFMLGLGVACSPLTPAASGGPSVAPAVSLMPPADQPATSSSAIPPRSISVSGSAEVLVVPDEVLLTLGVETSDPQLAAAKAKNDDVVTKVLRVARDNGVESKHVQTDYMHVEPRYQDSSSQRSLQGYWVRRGLVITVKDVAKFETLLGQSLEAGANYVQGADFRTTELRQHRDAARSLAIKAAREKATALAGELGQEIGQPLTIQEDYNRWYSPWSSWWGGSYGRGATQNVVQSTESAPTAERDTPLAPGQIAVDASVTVSFELKSPAAQ